MCSGVCPPIPWRNPAPPFSPSFSLFFLLLEVSPLNLAMGVGSAVSSQLGLGLWSGAPFKIQFGAF